MKITHRAVRAAAALLLAALAYGCTPDSESTVHYDYYITRYCYITQFNGYQYESQPFNKYITTNTAIYDTYESGSPKYYYYQNIYNDFTYNREREGMTNPVYCNYFLKIDAVSDADFDAGHPAGTSLGDMVRIVTASPYLYIQSGYDSAYEYNWRTDNPLPEDYIDLYPYYDIGYNPVNKLLCDLTPEDMKLMWGIDFIFAEQPSLSREHNLTFTFTDAEQGDMSFSCRFVFE